MSIVWLTITNCQDNMYVVIITNYPKVWGKLIFTRNFFWQNRIHEEIMINKSAAFMSTMQRLFLSMHEVSAIQRGQWGSSGDLEGHWSQSVIILIETNQNKLHVSSLWWLCINFVWLRGSKKTPDYSAIYGSERHWRYFT